MKKSGIILSSLITLSLLGACSNEATLNPMLPAQNSTVSSSSIDSQYLITAKAIADKMVKTTNATEQQKLTKDFAEQIKNANRPTLENLIKYVVVLHQSTNPPISNEGPLISLIHEAQKRYLDIFTDGVYSRKTHEIFMIAIEKDPKKQDALFQKFEKASLKSAPKRDLQELVKFVTGENSNFDEFLNPNSPLSKKILKVIQSNL